MSEVSDEIVRKAFGGVEQCVLPDMWTPFIWTNDAYAVLRAALEAVADDLRAEGAGKWHRKYRDLLVRVDDYQARSDNLYRRFRDARATVWDEGFDAAGIWERCDNPYRDS